jgi:hypothetical protein
MEIRHAYGCPYEDYEHGIMELDVQLEANETVSVGYMIRIEMMDDTFIEREVKIINPQYAGDFYPVSKKARESDWGRSKNPILSVTGECSCRLIVLDCQPSDVKTQENFDTKAFFDEMNSRFCLTPYTELRLGEESIYDNIDHSFSVPEKVILYLQTKELYFLCPGLYKHPFHEETTLCGPYAYSDGYYYWDRDTWKYVVKYGLTLPQQFIDYVMTDKATEFMNQKHNSDLHLAEKENTINLLPKDSGDIPLDQF